MTTKRLQMTLIPDLPASVQPLPADAQAESIELIAMMLVRLVGGKLVIDDATEVRNESR